jgi:hypothetical protein
MGNASSSEDVEEEYVLPVQVGEDSTTADESLTNFSSLFQPESLYKALLAIREPPGSALSRKKDGMIRWLSGLADKDEVIMTHPLKQWGTLYFFHTALGEHGASRRTLDWERSVQRRGG